MEWFLYGRNLCHERVNVWCPLKGHTYRNKGAAKQQKHAKQNDYKQYFGKK